MENTLQLSEGYLTLRVLTLEELKKLTAIEAENRSDPTRALSRYLPLIEATGTARLNSTVAASRLPKDVTAISYLLSTEEFTGQWKAVRTLYELNGIELPEGIAP